MPGQDSQTFMHIKAKQAIILLSKGLFESKSCIIFPVNANLLHLMFSWQVICCIM